LRIVAELRDRALSLAAISCKGVAVMLPCVIVARVLTKISLATTVATNSARDNSTQSMQRRVSWIGPNLHPVPGR
jgi:fructose-specific phosphotransferase system IIC component